ncbi:hypothetical protein EV426DRAFT_614663 [Tirmania nivea]|nr:hypothetical protein EV426DRAFT_614663 [Tirmania nivea]
MGVVPASLTHLAHPDNLLLLCASCHLTYDTPAPSWIMLPVDDVLDLYIRHEQQDYEARRSAGERGEVLRRTLPRIDRSRAIYNPYILIAGFAPITPLLPSQWPQVWGGEPTTAILKGVCGAFVPCPTNIVTTEGGHDVRLGVPSPTLNWCTQLVNLWNRPDPPITGTPAQEPPLKRRELGPRPGQGRGRGRGSGSGYRGGAGSFKGSTTKEPAGISSGSGVSGKELRYERSIGPEYFAFGPQMTSNELIRRVTQGEH